MNEIKLAELSEERGKLCAEFTKIGLENGLAALWVTAEGEDEDGCPCFGAAVLVDPILCDVVQEYKGEKAMEALKKDIQRVLEKAGYDITKLIAESSGNGGAKIVTYGGEE